MGKKKKTEVNFIDEVKRFSSHGEFTIGDWIVYKRVSDGSMSVGEVRWFCNSSEGMAVTVIDQNLGNFQLGLCSDIDQKATSVKVEKLIKVKKKDSK